MACNRNKVIIYGIIGIVIALTITTFLPTRKTINITTTINLENIPDYGLQTIKISEDNSKITNLVINVQSIEAQTLNGEWVKITNTENQWDLWQEPEKTFTLDQKVTGYSKLRLTITSNSSYVTLSDGRKTPLTTPSLPLEVSLLNPYNTEIEGASLKLSQSQGTASKHILPNLQVELFTHKIMGEIIAQ